MRCLGAALLMAVLAFSPAAAQEAASPWVEGPLSKVRILGGARDGATWQAGIEITLAGAAHTYWRFPGDSGVPPVFDFSGSKNLKAAVVLYPAPERMSEAGMSIFGYRGELIFPLRVEAADPAQPVALALHLSYAACEKICMPGEARLAFTLDPRKASATPHPRIAAFEARIPRPLESAGAPKLTLARAPGEKKTWRAIFSPALPDGADMIADGPDGWIFDTRRAADGGFEIVLAEKPADAGAKMPPITLTLTTAEGAYETVRHLDARPSTP